jgi:hypothetical protein
MIANSKILDLVATHCAQNLTVRFIESLKPASTRYESQAAVVTKGGVRPNLGQ